MSDTVPTKVISGRAAKRKGDRGERRAKKLLEAAGYHVLKAGGSLGCFDLVAINTQGLRCIQVKTTANGRGASPAEREAMRLAPLPTNAAREIWIFMDYSRTPIIQTL